MKIDKYFVKWKHFEEPIDTPENGIEEYTECIIYESTGIDSKKLIAAATVKKHRDDAPNRELARKYSLDKVLKIFTEDKALRTKFWETFRDLKADPKW